MPYFGESAPYLVAPSPAFNPLAPLAITAALYSLWKQLEVIKMDDCKKESSGFWPRLRSFLPTIIPILIVILAGGTDVFSSQVHELVGKSIHDRVVEFMPYMFNFLLAIAVVNFGWAIHGRCQQGVKRVLERNNASAPLTNFVTKGFKVFFWFVVVFIACSCFAPDLMGRIAAGATLVTAALTVSLTGIINDFIAGMLLPGSEFVKEGEEVKVNDVSVADGKVVKIGYVRTIIDTKENGPVSVPNSKLWASTIAKKPKAKSKLILPEDFGKEEKKA